MPHPHNNSVQRGGKRSGSLFGGSVSGGGSGEDSGLFSDDNKQKAALFASGGSSANLFLAGASKFAGGIEGLARAKSAKNQGKLLQFQAKSEEIIGEANATQALERLNDVQASNIVASFASGIRLQGSSAVVQQVVSSQADFSAALSKANAELVAGGLKREARVAFDFAGRLRKRAQFDMVIGSVMMVAAFA